MSLESRSTTNFNKTSRESKNLSSINKEKCEDSDVPLSVDEVDDELNDSQKSLNTDKNNQKDINMDNRRKRRLNDSNLDDPILDLKWWLRGDIINTFIKLSALINFESIEVAHKQELIRLNSDLIQKLSVLLPVDNRNEFNDLKDSQKASDSDCFEKMSYKLNWSDRNHMIDLLMKNFNLILNDSASNEDKTALTQKNNNVIAYLISLDIKNSVDRSNSTGLFEDFKINGMIKFYSIFYLIFY